MADRPPLRILVCGGRNFSDRKALYWALDDIHRSRGISCIIHGAAPGADRMAGEWGHEHDVPVIPFRADWGRYGLSAGMKRNTKMLEHGKPDGVVAMPGGVGTADMKRKSRAAGLIVWEPLAKV